MSINVADNILLALSATPTPEQAVEETELSAEFTLDPEITTEPDVDEPLVPQQQLVRIDKAVQNFIPTSLSLDTTEAPTFVDTKGPSEPSPKAHTDSAANIYTPAAHTQVGTGPITTMPAGSPTAFVSEPTTKQSVFTPIITPKHETAATPQPTPGLEPHRVLQTVRSPQVSASSRANIEGVPAGHTGIPLLRDVEPSSAPRQSETTSIVEFPQNAQSERIVESPKQPLQTDGVTNGERAIFEKPDLFRSIVQSAQLTPVTTQTTSVKIISQIMSTIPNTPGDTVELRLDPPELGRVIVSITQTDSGLVALITAEKSEILELLRRNAELLQREFSKSGLDNATLNFSHKEQNPHNSPFIPDDTDAPLEFVERVETIPVVKVSTHTDSLDVRL